MKKKIALQRLLLLTKDNILDYVVFDSCIVYNGCLYKDKRTLIESLFLDKKLQDLENTRELRISNKFLK